MRGCLGFKLFGGEGKILTELTLVKWRSNDLEGGKQFLHKSLDLDPHYHGTPP